MMKYVLCVALLAVSLDNVRALGPEEIASIHEKLLPYIMECSKELGVEKEAIKEAKEKDDLDGVDSCFFACVFKKAGTIDDKGMFVPEKALDRLKESLTKEEDIELSKKVAADCTSVNSEDVSDGEAGCDRAKLLMGCLFKHKNLFLGN